MDRAAAVVLIRSTASVVPSPTRFPNETGGGASAGRSVRRRSSSRSSAARVARVSAVSASGGMSLRYDGGRVDGVDPLGAASISHHVDQPAPQRPGDVRAADQDRQEIMAADLLTMEG